MKTLTARLGLPQWSAVTDSVGRQDFNAAFSNLEERAALDDQGLRSARPNPGVRGRYYFATDLNTLYRDSGTSWSTVGAVVDGSIATAPNVSTPAGIYRGANNQSADILQVQNNSGSTLWSLTRQGGMKAGGVYVTGNAAESAPERLGNASLTAVPLGTTLPAVVVQGLAGQSTSLLQIRNSSGTTTANITAGGEGTFVAAYRASAGAPGNTREFTTHGHAESTYLKQTEAASVYETKTGVGQRISNFLSIQQANIEFLKKVDAENQFAAKNHDHPAVSLGTQGLTAITTDGTYLQLTASNATLARNYPIANTAGMVEVTTIGTVTYQRFTEFGNNNDIWTRRRTGTTWTSWTRLAMASELDNKVVNVSGVASIRKVTRAWYDGNSHDANTLYVVV